MSEKKPPEKNRIESAQASLDAMMAILRPFLPPLDLGRPEPARKWRLTSTGHSTARPPRRTGASCAG